MHAGDRGDTTATPYLVRHELSSKNQVTLIFYVYRERAGWWVICQKSKMSLPNSEHIL